MDKEGNVEDIFANTFGEEVAMYSNEKVGSSNVLMIVIIVLVVIVIIVIVVMLAMKNKGVLAKVSKAPKHQRAMCS